MRKIQLALLFLCTMLIFQACDQGGSEKTTKIKSPDTLSAKFIGDLGSMTELSEEQKAKIKTITAAANITGDKTSEENRVKFIKLKQQIFKEVLTPEQQTALKGNMGNAALE